MLVIPRNEESAVLMAAANCLWRPKRKAISDCRF